MKFLPTNCIYCNTDQIQCDGSTDTTFTLTLDGDKIVVKVCDAHSEDASVKSAKEHYLNKKKEFDEMVAKAASFGMTFGPQTDSGVILATAPEVVQPVSQKPQRPPRPPQQDPTIIPEDSSLGFVDLSKAESIQHNPIVHSSGNTSVGGSTVGRYNLNETKQQLSKAVGGAISGKVQLARMEGRRGSPVIVPMTTIDNTGTTKVRVVNNIQDYEFQQRFKDMAESSKQGNVHFADGYNTDSGVMDCPLCEGNCEVKHKGVMIRCPKCDGSGCL